LAEHLQEVCPSVCGPSQGLAWGHGQLRTSPLSEVCGSLGMEVGQMTHDQDDISHRPERVIILDADNPMIEVHGRFVWQDEHERVLAAAWDRAYAEGYAAGRLQPVEVMRMRLRRRRGLLDYIRLVILSLGVLIVLLMLPIVLL
jgi:hypothetical protein